MKDLLFYFEEIKNSSIYPILNNEKDILEVFFDYNKIIFNLHDL
jgi:hypothetical protein